MVLLGTARPEIIQNFKISHIQSSLITATFDITKLSYVKLRKPVITKHTYTHPVFVDKVGYVEDIQNINPVSY